MKLRCFVYLSILMLASLAVVGVQAQEAPEGLLLYLSFDEGTGNIVGDFSGNGNDGELVDGPEWVDGQDGKALQFDGKGSYVKVPYDEMFNLTEAFTLAAWVKPAVAPFAGEVWRGVINGQMTNYGPYLLQITEANGEFGAWLNGSWQWQKTAAVVDAKNFWHLVGTYEDGEGFTTYVNGELDSEGPRSGAVKDNVDEGIVIGHNYGLAGRWFEGVVDEVAIYNRAITAEEVKDLFEGNVKANVRAVDASGKLATTWSALKM